MRQIYKLGLPIHGPHESIKAFDVDGGVTQRDYGRDTSDDGQ